MVSYWKEIDERALAAISAHEEAQLEKFRKEFEGLCANVTAPRGWTYKIYVDRWTDPVGRYQNRPFDGYTATLQVDFMDRNGDLAEWDETVCSFFENITYIAFHPFRRKYRVFQSDAPREVPAEIKRFQQRLAEA